MSRLLFVIAVAIIALAVLLSLLMVVRYFLMGI